MILEIAGINIANVCKPPRINQTHRSQSVNISLNGNTLIDRIGGHKYSIIIEIPFIKDNLWYSIIPNLKLISFNVRFQFGGEILTRQFYLNGEIPSPVSFVKNNQAYFQGISLRLEEL
jgi:hypothetical protein